MCFDIHLISAQHIYTNESCALQAGVQISWDHARQTWITRALYGFSQGGRVPGMDRCVFRQEGPIAQSLLHFRMDSEHLLQALWIPEFPLLSHFHPIPKPVLFCIYHELTLIHCLVPDPSLLWTHGTPCFQETSHQCQCDIEKIEYRLCGNHGSPTFQSVSPVQFFYIYL